MSELSDMIKNWNTDILKDEDRVYDSKDDINRLIKVIPLLGEGIIQMKTSTRNLMINGLPLGGKLYKGTGSDTSGIVEVVPEGTDYVYHMAKSGTTQGAWSIKSTDTTSISQIPYVSEDVLFTNTLIKGSGTATLQFLDKDGNVLSEMTTPALTDTYQAFNVKGQLKDSVWSFKIVASDAIYFKQVMITRSSFPSDYMLSEEELEQLNIINTSGIDANTVTKSHAYQVIGLKNCPANVSTSGLFITIQKDNFVQVFVPNDDTGIYYRVGVTTNRPNTKWTRLATSDNTYSKDDFTEMRTSDNINLIQDSSMSAGFWAFTKDGASTSVGSLNTADGIAHITGNGTSGTSWAQYQVTNQNYQQPLIQNSEIQYDQDYTVSVETTWSDGADIASNDEMPPSLVVRENYKDGTSKDLIRDKAVDKYGQDKWHKLSGTFKFSENRKNDISFIRVILMWKGAKGDVYFRRPKLEMANLPSAYTDDTVARVEPNHNLLQDSRDLLDGWKMKGSKVSLDTTGDMARYQGMRVQHLFGDWSYYGTTKTPVLENGKYYTVSAYMRGLSEADINMYATILINKSNSGIINFPLAKHLTGEWRRYSYTFKFDANTQVVNTSAIRVEGQGDWAPNGSSVYVAGIKLEEGKTATDWSPSIEEIIVRYETQNWQKDKITADNGDLALRINSSGTDPMDKQFLSATGTKTFYLQDGATGNNTGGSLRGILVKDNPSFGNAYAINDKNELWFLSIQNSKLTTWSKVAKEADVMAIKDEVIDARKPKSKESYATLGERLDNEHNNNLVDESLIVGGYVKDYFDTEIKRVKSELTSGLFTFAQMNDTHWETIMRNNPEAYRSLNHLKNLLSFADVSDLLLLNGDNTNSDTASLDGVKKDIDIFTSVFFDEPLNTDADRFINLGNHDDGSTRRERQPNRFLSQDNYLHDDYFREAYRTGELLNGETRNKDSIYCFKDYPDKKIRFILLNTSDIEENQLDANGSQKYDRWGTHTVRQEQMTWLAEVALKDVPEDYHVVVAGHAPLNANMGGGSLEDNGGKYINLDIVLGLLAAFKEGTIYNATSTNADYPLSIFTDFTKQGARNLVGYFCGHTHRDSLTTANNITICEVACSLFYKNDLSRYVNTATEDGFDVIQIDTNNHKVIISGFGYCKDRGFSY